MISPSLLNIEEIAVLDDFIERVNTLARLDAITIDNSLEILKKPAPTAESLAQPRTLTFNIIIEARNHANELKDVYDNALFGTKHLVAGSYFAERVKGNGI